MLFTHAQLVGAPPRWGSGWFALDLKGSIFGNRPVSGLLVASSVWLGLLRLHGVPLIPRGIDRPHPPADHLPPSTAGQAVDRRLPVRQGHTVNASARHRDQGIVSEAPCAAKR